jgi:tripartite-type tricarboxylate transporter receptor subunit TctC
VVAKAAHDGYTLLMAPSNHATTPALYRQLPYDTIRDFAPVSTVAYNPHVLVVSASLPISSVADLIALAKSKPGGLNYGSGGIGSGTHLEGELLNSMAKVNIVHVPYKGVGQSLADVAAGRVQMAFSSALAAMPFIKTGKAKAVAATSSKRAAAMPDVPTFAESGLPQFIVETPQGIFAPAGTSRTTIMKLNAEIVKITKSPDVRELMASQGSEAAGSTPEQYGAKIAQEVERWRKIVREAGIPVQ